MEEYFEYVRVSDTCEHGDREYDSLMGSSYYSTMSAEEFADGDAAAFGIRC